MTLEEYIAERRAQSIGVFPNDAKDLHLTGMKRRCAGWRWK